MEHFEIEYTGQTCDHCPQLPMVIYTRDNQSSINLCTDHYGERIDKYKAAVAEHTPSQLHKIIDLREE